MCWRCLSKGSSGMLLGGSCIEILLDPLQLQQQALSWRSFLRDCLRNPGMYRSWSGLVRILALRGPCMILYRPLWRSCWNPPQKILALRSWRCSALVSVWKLFWDVEKVLLWWSFEIILDVLVWGSGMRSWWVDIALLRMLEQAPAVKLAIMSNLLCCCCIATAACICCIGFWPPILFGVSCRCNG